MLSPMIRHLVNPTKIASAYAGNAPLYLQECIVCLRNIYTIPRFARATLSLNVVNFEEIGSIVISKFMSYFSFDVHWPLECY